MKIVIDARFYGLENAGLGRYTINLIDQLQKLDKENDYFILLRKKYFESLNLQKNFQKILADIPHYGFGEQIELPRIINKINPDFTHFLHFNMPIFWRGKFVVTIHDMTMHFQSTNATSLLLPIYLVKHFVYKMVFAIAVKRSEKIIVPSEFIKKQIANYFKISGEKITVTYEGV